MSELLRREVAATTGLEAECWKKLEELVKLLESDGGEEEVWGHIFSKSIWLREAEPRDPALDEAFKKFRAEWQAANPDFKQRGKEFLEECKKRFPSTPKIRITIWMDWPDYATAENVMSRMHYRFQIDRPGKQFSEDAREQNIAEAGRIVRAGFGW